MQCRPSAVNLMSRKSQRSARTGGARAVASRDSWEVVLVSRRHTAQLGRAIGLSLRGGETLALTGPLGAGKTSLVRGIAAGLGASPASVSSPTFVIIHEYQGRLPLIHADLYRINSVRELESTGLSEYLSGPAVLAIEWADKAPEGLSDDRLEVELRHRTVESRTVRLRATGSVSRELLTQTRTRFGRSMSRRSVPRKRSNSNHTSAP